MDSGGVTKRRYRFPNGKTVFLHRLGADYLCPVCGDLAGNPFELPEEQPLADGSIQLSLQHIGGSYYICPTCRAEYGHDCVLEQSDVVDDDTGDSHLWRHSRGTLLQERGRTPKIFKLLARIDRQPDFCFVEPPENVSPLILAAARGDLSRLTSVLNDGISVVDIDRDGWTALHWSAARGDADAAHLLLSAGAAVDALNARGETPLMWASGCEFPEIIRELIAGGASPHMRTPAGERGSDHHLYGNVPGGGGRTALHWAASNGAVGAAKTLISFGADPNAPDASTHQPLMLAGSAEVAIALVEQGAAIHALDFRNFSALMHAARDGRLDVMRVLLDRGADANGQSDRPLGHTALSLAASLECAPAGKDTLAAVNLLLERGADPNRPAADGMFVLEYAARQPRTEVVHRLIDAGAEINARGYRGATALHGSLSDCGNSSEANTFALLQAGADVNIKANRGITPLMKAAGGRRAPRLQVLLSAGARVADVDQQGWTALHYAASQGYADAAARLIAAGADRQARANDGTTPLMLATKRAANDIVAILGSGAST